MRKVINDLYRRGYEYIFDIGDTSAVEVDGKYGIMQFAGIVTSVGGFNYDISKIFTDLISHVPNEEELESILKSENYYYNNNGLSAMDYAETYDSSFDGFHEITYLGIHPIYGGQELPRYWRSCDTNPYTGKVWWYLHDNTTYAVKKVKCCDEEFKKLSPEPNWGLGVIESNWRRHFTLDTWDDNYLRECLDSYYKKFPESRPRKVEYETAKNAYPPLKWVKETPLKEEKDEPIRKGYRAILEALKEYISAIDGLEKKTAGELRKLTKNVVKRLNEIDKEYECIETVEREDLWEYFANVLWSLKKPTVIDVIDEVREW